MKVKIFTEGGKSTGYGHLSRCLSLYEEIRSRGIDSEFIVQGDVEVVGFLEDISMTKQNWMNLEYLEKTITKEDYVIVDSYLACKECYEKIASKSRRALYLDDTGRIEYPIGIIVNPTFITRNIDYSYKTNDRVLTGSKHVILRSAFIGMKRQKIKDSVQKVLIVMGGTDIRNISSIIIENICGQNKDIFFDIVLNAVQYEKYAYDNKFENIKYHTNLSEIEMSNIMLSSDMAISAAGQTVYELIATQTPFIAIQVADNQQNNINSIAERISSRIVLRYDDENFIVKFRKIFLEMKRSDFRKKISDEMNDTIDGYGKKRIIDSLLFDIHTNNEIFIRKAFNDDLKDVFELSNQDYVRQYSINSDKILWAHHVKWFNKVLQDSNIVFYVITNKSNFFLGQVRYELEKDTATVSISLSEHLRGKGLSKTILNQSIHELFSEKAIVNEIIAYVLEKNVVSMKIFKSLNFTAIDTYAGMTKLILRRNYYYDNQSF